MSKLKAPAPWVLWCVAILINCLWALAYPWSKLVMGDFSPLALSFWRMFTGGLVLLPFIEKKDLPKKIVAKDIVLLALMGIIGCSISTWLQFVATVHTFSSHVSILVSIETITVMIFARLFLKEAISIFSWLGSLIALVGVAIISLDSSSLSQISPEVLWGNFLMLLAVSCYASYTIIGKLLSDRWGSSALTALPFVFSVLFLFPFLAFGEKADFSRAFRPTQHEWMLIFYVGSVCAGFGFLAWNWLLRFMDAAELSKSLYIQPIAGIFFSNLILAEKIDLKMLLGAAIVIAGVLLSEKKTANLRRDARLKKELS